VIAALSFNGLLIGDLYFNTPPQANKNPGWSAIAPGPGLGIV